MRHPLTRHGAALFTVIVLLTLIPAACADAPAAEEDTLPPVEQSPVPVAGDETSGGNPHIAADVCALVPLADVAAAVGGGEPMRTEPGVYPPASCRYFYDVVQSGGSRQASATVQMLDDYGLERSGEGDAAIDVTGIGDEAWAVSYTDTYLLYVRRGPLVFSVNVAGGDSDAWPAMARSVTGVVLERL